MVINDSNLRDSESSTSDADISVDELRPYDGCVLPPQASAIEELHDWSLNYSAGRNPYCIFIDLIGYSDQTYGCTVFCWQDNDWQSCLGYKELCMLSDALKVFKNNGYDQVYAWCSALNEAEEADNR